MRRAFLLAGWLCALASSTEAQSTPKKFALLVGVTTYEHTHLNQPPKIQYPEADAQEIGAELKNAGYEVEVLVGKAATQDDVRRKLEQLSRKGNEDGVVLVGFFGHGVEYSEKNAAGKPVSRSYFCPYDARMQKRLDSLGREVLDDNGKPRIQPDPASLISMADVFEAIRLSPAGHRVLLADCCRDDPHAARGRSGFGAGINKDDLPENAKIAAIFACSKGEQALEDSERRHGVFSQCVLDWLRQSHPRATAGRLGEHLEEAVPLRVAELTERRQAQTPRYLNFGTVDLQLTIQSPANKVITNSLGMKLVLVPAGEFLMGSPESDTDDERPQHKVRITKAFYLGQTEVTQGQWKAVMGTEPWKGETYVREGADYAATYVSWNDATEFCRKLSAKEGQTYQLPTEAQWEYACRGGTKTQWSFGDSEGPLGDYAWYFKNAWDIDEKYAHRVGLKKANPFGLFDLHGNVREWCRDVYDKNAYGNRHGTTSDPFVNTGSNFRVLRGGSWDYIPQYSRSAIRNRYTPDSRSSDFGFRVSRTQ